MHPSQAVDVESEYNYYQYSWMKDPEEVSTLNKVALASLAGLIAVCIVLLVATKLLRFIQFFIAKKQYAQIDISVVPDEDEQPFPVEAAN